MNWDAVGAIGEVVGALGVICTLAYLAVQIRQNTESVKTSTVQAMLEASASFSDLCASHEELGRIFITGIKSRSSLSKEEKVRFHYLMTSYIRRIEAFYLQGKGRYLLDEDWQGIRFNFIDVMTQPGSQDWWQRYSERFHTRFVDWVSGEVSRLAAQ